MALIIIAKENPKYILEHEFDVTFSHETKFLGMNILTLDSSTTFDAIEKITKKYGKPFTYNGRDYLLENI